MRSVIFAPGRDDALSPLTKLTPKSMIPVLNKPMLEFQIEQLRDHGIREIKFILYNHPEQISHYFYDGKKWQVNLSYTLEKNPNGDFRSLRKIRSFLNEPFIFCNASYFNKIDVSALVKQHRKSGAVVTIGANAFSKPDGLYTLECDKAKYLNGIKRLKDKELGREALISTGIFCFNPEIIHYLDEESLHEIERDLFPALLKDGRKISVYQSHDRWHPLRSLRDYWHLNVELISEKEEQDKFAGRILKNGVWTGSDSGIRSRLKDDIEPPVLIGNHTRIGRNVLLRGPCIIGNHVKIDDGAIIEKSVILDHTYVGKMVEIRESIVAKNCHISVPTLFGTFVEEDFIIGELNRKPLKMLLNRFLISAFDRTVAIICLLLLSPFFLIIALLIKLDSGGPVFYVSKRLKRPEKKSRDDYHYQFIREESVNYYVFRTMYMNADQRLDDYQKKNIYEAGPYHKIKNDPRVTRIGGFLRKSSLDELPLLYNVVKGDMSLVGIWALPAYEAKALQSEGLRSGKLDLSETARVRFKGKLGLAGFWQARGRSNLTAEERALHDSFQSALYALNDKFNGYVDTYSDYLSFKGYLKILFETFAAVVKRQGAQ